MTRRDLIAGLGAAPLLAQSAEPAPTRPQVCVFSKHLPKLTYAELGPTVKQLGFDGVDLTVRAGGHVLPEKAQVDLLRAIESIRADVDVPMITTGILSVAEPMAQFILAVAGRMKVPFYIPGYWRYTAKDDVEARVAAVRRDVAGLVAVGRQYGITCGFHNHSGDYVGTAVWDTRAIIGDMDPRWIGYYFDPCHATAEGGVAGWNVALRMALPRLKMVALKDFYWEKVKGKWKMQMCALGEGMVDWPKVFAMFAAARFTGPISLHLEYDPKDELAALSKDLAFVRKQIAAAYGG